MRAALACALLLPSLPALADGPALAHLTLAGTTITLTEVAPTRAGEAMAFAQMHLGFPLPPILRILLEDGTMHGISLNGTDGGSNGTGTPLGPETFLWFEPGAIVTGDDQQFQIEAEALSRTALGQFTSLPVQIEIQLRSP